MLFFFFFTDTATTEIYTLSLHDALPISSARSAVTKSPETNSPAPVMKKHRSASPSQAMPTSAFCATTRSEEHTSELQSRFDLVCRLLLEKKKKKKKKNTYTKHQHRSHMK